MSITKAERKLYEWQYGTLGSFSTQLYNLISKADTKNLEKLTLAYPDEVLVITKYKTQKGYWDEVKLKMKIFQSMNFKADDISPCAKCHSVTHTVNNGCGKCGEKK